MSSSHQISISSSSESESQLSLPTHNIKYRNYRPTHVFQPALNQYGNLPNQDDNEIKNRNQIIVVDDEDEVQDQKEANQDEQGLLDVVQISREVFRSKTNHLKKLMNTAFRNTQQLGQPNRQILKVEPKRENQEREYKKSIGLVQKQEIANQINQNLFSISSGGLVNNNEEADSINSKDVQFVNSEQIVEVNDRIGDKQFLRELKEKSNSQTIKFKYNEQNFFMGIIDKKKNILTDQDLTEEEIEKLQNLIKFKANIFIPKFFVVNIYLLTQLILYFNSQSNKNQSDLKEIESSYFNERISSQTDQDDDVGSRWKLTQTRQNMLSFMYTFLEAFNFTDYGLLKLFIYECNSSQIYQIFQTILSEIKASVQQISNLKKMNKQNVQCCLNKILSIPFFQKPKREKQMENFLKDFYLPNPISINLRQLPEDKNKTISQSNKKRVIYPKNTIFLNQEDKIKQSSHLSKKSSKKQQIEQIQGTQRISQKEKIQMKDNIQEQKVQMGKVKQGTSSEFPKRRTLIRLGDYSTYGTQEKKKSQFEEEIEEGEIVELSQPAKKKH